MPKEVPGSKSEATKAEGVQYTPEGFYPVDTANGLANIVRFKSSDGETFEITVPIGQRALNLQPDNLRERNYTPFSGRMRYLVGALAESLGLRKLINAAALSILLAACNDPDFSEKPRKAVAGYNTKSEELTTDQLSTSLKGQVAPWTDWGDIPGNFAEMDGKHYVLFSNIYTVDPVTGKKEVYYIECDQLDQCFDATAQRQTLGGLKEAQLPGPFSGVGFYPSQENPDKHRIIVDPNGEWAYEGDVSKDPDTGKLVAENLGLKGPSIDGSFIDGSFSIYIDKDIPHVIEGGDKAAFDLNLFDNSKIQLLPDAPESGAYDICGMPTFDGDLLAIGSKLEEAFGGIKNCKLTFESSLKKLTVKGKLLTGVNSQATGPVRRLGNPRIASSPDGSGIFMYSSTNGSPGDLGGNPLSEIWFVKISAPPPPDPVEPSPDATGSGDAGDPDAGTATGGETTDTPDAGTAPDTGPEILDTTVSEDPDTTEEPEVTAEDVADAIAQDVADAVEFLEDLGVDVAAIQDLLDQESDNQGDSPETEEDSDVPPVDAEKPDTETADDTQNPPDTTSGDTEIYQDTKPSPDTTLPTQEPQPQPESSKDAGRTTASPHADATLSSPEAEKTAPESAGCIAGKTPTKSGHLGIIGSALLLLVSTLRRKRR